MVLASSLEVLRSLTSLGFIFTASHNGLLSGTPLPHLASEALLNPRGRFPQSFSSCIPHHCRTRTTWTTLPGDYLPALGAWLLDFQKLSFVIAFQGQKTSPGHSYLPIGRFAFYFLICSFHFRLYIFISFSLRLFSIMDLLKWLLITTRQSLLGCLEISASGRFLEQGQKATFFASLSRIVSSLVASIDLPLEPHELGLHGLHFSQQHCLPNRLLGRPAQSDQAFSCPICKSCPFF